MAEDIKEQRQRRGIAATSSIASDDDEQTHQQQGSWQQKQQDRLQRLRQYRQQKMMEKLHQLRAQYVSEYSLPLNYPARVIAASDSRSDLDISKDEAKGNNRARTDAEFVNARLLEAGVAMGGGVPGLTPPSSSSASLSNHGLSIARFIRDLEGTGCYDAVQVFIGRSEEEKENESTTEEGSGDDRRKAFDHFDVTVRLKEKKWYKLYIGGGVNSDDFSLAGSGGRTALGNAFGGSAAGAAAALPKLQFETSASLLNITGFTDVSTAAYSIDQTGASSFKFTHDRPLCSVLSQRSKLYEWFMPPDPRTIDPNERESNRERDNAVEESDIFLGDDAQYFLGGGSHTSLGFYSTIHDQDYEALRSSKDFIRSIGVRLANHCRGASQGPGFGGPMKTCVTPPEAMAGPYFYFDWSASLRDVLPRRHGTFPFALDCSKEVAWQAGTTLKHSLVGGFHYNGCLTDDRYDPTMGYDAHLVGEVAGPPGDVGFWKLKGGMSWHAPVELLRIMAFGVSDDEYKTESTKEGKEQEQADELPDVIGATLHSSFNFGLLRGMSFGGLCNQGSMGIPSSDRFYIGGPGQLRGFMPAGIGPRTTKGGSNVPGGDSLGGDLFYTSTIAASIPAPSYFNSLRQNGVRLFGFANSGTCVSTSGLSGHSLFGTGCIPAWTQILYSTRLAAGVGLSVGSPMGRLEATYAVPLRYGPRDARKSVQFGFGFTFG